MKDLLTIDWNKIELDLNEKGYSKLDNLLAKDECLKIIDLYNDGNLYRSVISMKRYRFGLGEYKYFKYPLPEIIQKLREEIYPKLAGFANTWMKVLNIATQFPDNHKALIEQCNLHRQLRPTPLILKYETGGFNTLHQDLYGEVYFPFQIVFVLTQQGVDHEGGELVFTEQIPRAQSKASVLVPNQGDAIIFTTNFRPIKGTRGYYRAVMKHGVSEVKSGTRYSLGVIFHDAT